MKSFETNYLERYVLYFIQGTKDTTDEEAKILLMYITKQFPQLITYIKTNIESING